MSSSTADALPCISVMGAAPDISTGRSTAPSTSAGNGADICQQSLTPHVSDHSDSNDRPALPFNMVCLGCGKGIVRERTLCSSCSRPYHPGCVTSMKILPNGAFQRCCGMKAKKVSPKRAVSLSGDDRDGLISEITKAIRKEIRVEVMGAMKEAIGRELESELRRSMTAAMTAAVGTAVSTAFDSVSKKLFKELGDVKAAVGDLREANETSDTRLTTLEEGLTTLSDRMTSFEDLADAASSTRNAAKPDEYLDEIEDRLSRKRNVIAFGIPESQGGDAQTRKQRDIEALSGIFTELSFVEDMSAIRCFRLGKFSSNLARPRPLKVVTSSSDKAANLIIIASQKRMRDGASAALRQTLILPDQTESQRLRFRLLKAELERRRASEANPGLKIITRNGIPRIVSAEPGTIRRARLDVQEVR